MNQVIVVVQQPASTFKLELARMVVDAFVNEGVSAGLTLDGDEDFLDAPATVLFGDCLGFAHTSELLRARRSGDRPETTLWQIEPLPPLVDEAWAMGAGRMFAAQSWSRLQRSRAMALIRSLTPAPVRSGTRRTLERSLTRGGGARLGPGAPLRNRYPGSRRFARVAWIERASREGWLDHVATTAPERRNLLAARGIDARFVPIGYHPAMGTDDRGPRDLDTVFLGRVKRGRAPALAKLTRALQARGVSLTVNAGPIYGEERSRFLNRARISINVLNDVWELSRTRALLSMACGALVVSEPVANPTPFRPGEHIVFASLDEMPDAIMHFLAHDDERKAITDAARTLLSGELSMQRILFELATEWDSDLFGTVP